MISGFSIVKNGERLGFPYKESLRSLAPLVDEIVVAHGDSDDSTLAELEKIASTIEIPIHIIDSPWDPDNLSGGLELSRQSNIALDACSNDLCFYIQADEVLHEGDYSLLREDLKQLEQRNDVDALALEWRHFFGNYKTIAHSQKWYRREIRAIKKSRNLRSYGDAQGFRVARPHPNAEGTGTIHRWLKCDALLSQARIFHYGWVRPPESMAQKSEELDRLWHGNARDGSHRAESMYPIQYGLREFNESHPSVMHARIQDTPYIDPFKEQSLERNLRYYRLAWADWLESKCNWRIGEFKNYRRLVRSKT